MKIVVYGAGAVGTWLGVHLSRAGANVTFIARGATFDWLSQSPMELRSPDGSLCIDAHVAHTISDDADLVIFATKTLGPVDLPELPATTTILTAQNSVEMPHLAVEKYGPERVIPGVVRSFLTRIAPGITSHDGNIQTLTFGSLHPDTRDLTAQLAEILSKTPITPTVRDDILADVWAKA
ncbi:ketopantoate reductase family protein, partial [Corynebacterium matruchotii]|uniref:ketopantoate reductase family protein n=1 Tax=Corynebacterium matruchotii TaxID=43768 RepID=UPI0028EFA06D